MAAMHAPQAMDLPAAVAQACASQQLLAPGQRVLVAVSAGADSTALAVLLGELARHGLALHLELAHLDHGWRGAEEAQADLTRVEELAKVLGLSLHVRRAKAGEARGEERARRWRYRALEETAYRHHCALVATGHHAGDQAETLLMRLLRGSGPVGLAAIPARRPLGSRGLTVVRPLLGIEPERLRDFLRQRGLRWREDPTNQDLRYERVRARARLALHPDPPAATRSLVDLAQTLARMLSLHQRRLEALASGALQVHAWADAVGLPRALLQEECEPHLDIILRLMGRPLFADHEGPFLTRRHVALVRRLLAQGGALDLPRGLAFHARGKTAWLHRRRPQARRASLQVEPLALTRPPAFPASSGLEALLDAQVLGSEPVLRPLRAADTFTPLGTSVGGRTRVADWLQRRGVPAFVRRQVWVLEGRLGVAWVVGYRVDRRHGLGAHSTQAVRVRASFSRA